MAAQEHTREIRIRLPSAKCTLHYASLIVTATIACQVIDVILSVLPKS